MFTQALLLASIALGAHATTSSFPPISSFQAAASSSTSSIQAQTTLDLFIDGNPSEGFVGSIVTADACSTLIAYACTRGAYEDGYGSTSCDPANSVTATYGPGYFEISTSTAVGGEQAQVVESCTLMGTTEAVCSASIYVSAEGKHTATSSIETLTGTAVNYYQVPITAGASMLSGLGACTGTASGNAAAATGISDVYKVVVVPAAAALLAGVLL